MGATAGSAGGATASSGTCQLEQQGCEGTTQVTCQGTQCQCILNGGVVKTAQIAEAGNCSMGWTACGFGELGGGTFGTVGTVGGPTSTASSPTGGTASGTVSGTIGTSGTLGTTGTLATAGTVGCGMGPWASGATASTTGGGGLDGGLPSSCSPEGSACEAVQDAGICSEGLCICRANAMPHSETARCVILNYQPQGPEVASEDSCVDAARQGFPAEAGAYDALAQATGANPGIVQLPSDGGSAVGVDRVTGLHWQLGPPATGYTQASAQSYCDSLSGANESWRLPTPAEEVGLLDYGSSGLLPPPLVGGGDVWTSATVVGSSGAQGWSVSESTGTTSMIAATTPLAVRCVSDDSPACPASARFVLASTAVVVDGQTGLTWQRAPTAGTMDWQSALGYCASLGSGEGDSWRLPSAKELQTLVDYGNEGPAIDNTAFQLPVPECIGTSQYWTSTPNPADPSAESAFEIDLSYGTLSAVSFGASAEPLCVR